MKRSHSLGVVLCASGVMVGVANASFIDFDDIGNSGVTWLAADHYALNGVLFEDTIPNVSVADFDPGYWPYFNDRGGSGDHAIGLANAINRLAISATFMGLDSTTPMTVDGVSIDVFDANIGSILGVLKAFDLDGNLIGTSTMLTPIGEMGTLSIVASGIARIEISSDSDGALFDNLSFSVSSMPAPGALALLGVAGLIARRRRTR